MANRPRDGFGGASDIDESDPFADLARIIGFDPREKVSRDEQASQQQDAQASDEFGHEPKDAEATTDEPFTSEPAVVEEAAIEHHAAAASENDSFEPAFSEAQTWQGVSAISSQGHSTQPQPELTKEEFHFDEAAFELAEGDEPVAEQSMQAGSEPDFDLSLDDFDLDEDDFGPAQPASDAAASSLQGVTAFEPEQETEPVFELETGDEQSDDPAPVSVIHSEPSSDLNATAKEAVESSHDDDFANVFETEFDVETPAAAEATEVEAAAYAPQAPANSNQQDYELSDQQFDLEIEDWNVEDAPSAAETQPFEVNVEHGSYEPQAGYDSAATPAVESFQAQMPAYDQQTVTADAQAIEPEEPASAADDLEATLAASFEEDLNLDLDDAFTENDFAFDLEDEPEPVAGASAAGDVVQVANAGQPSEPETLVAFEPEQAVEEDSYLPLVAEAQSASVEPQTEPLAISEPEAEAEDLDFDLAFDTSADQPEQELASEQDSASVVELKPEAVSAPEPQLAIKEPPPQSEVFSAEPDFEDELAALLAGAAPIAAAAAVSHASEPHQHEPVSSTAEMPFEADQHDQAYDEKDQVELSDADFEEPVAEAQSVEAGFAEKELEPVTARESTPVRAETPAITPPTAEPAKAPVDDDPFAALAAMAARYRASRSASAATPPPSSLSAEKNDDKGTEDAMRTTMQPRTPAPEIETVDVFEQAVALPDDLDIPEMHFEERSAQPQHYDDLDNEFAELLNDMSDNGRVAQQSAPKQQNSASWDSQDAAPRATQRQDYSGKQYASGYGYAASQQGDLEEDPAWAMPPRDDQYDDYDDELVYEDDQPEERRSILPKPGTLLAMLIGGVVLAGGGWFALGSGGVVGSGEPAIIKADATPLKQRPENPGGITVPNQDSKVYERVSGAQTAEEQQAALISTNEAPVDLNSGTDEPITEGLDLDGTDPDVEMMSKSEDRIDEQMADQGVEQTDEGIAITPHKVRTMVVNADGTLAPAGDETPAASAAVEPAVNAARAALQQTQAGSQAANVASAERTGSIAALSADDAPAAESAAPTQVAAVAPGAWAIQLASVPSEAAAKSTYDGLTKKYGSVLGGRGVNIVKAEVAGKGTFYRVRVPTQTRDEAVQLCTNLKSAGGSCFVSK